MIVIESESECDCEQGSLCKEDSLGGGRVVERLPRRVVVSKNSHTSIKDLSSLPLCIVLLSRTLFNRLIMSHSHTPTRDAW